MRRVACAIGLITAVLLLAGRAGVSAQQSLTLDIKGGTAGASLEIALNGGKIRDVTPDTQGNATMSVLDLSNLGKVRVTVFVDRCEDGKIVKVQFVTDGNSPPPVDQKCDRKPAGFFWSNSRRVTINVTTLKVSSGSMLTSKPVLIGGGAAALVGIGLIATGGDSNDMDSNNNQNPNSSNPAGTYNVTITVTSDLGGHVSFINLGNSGTIVVTGTSSLQFASSIRNWVATSGTFSSSNGSFNATGRGTVAGFSNVNVTFTGTITTSGAISGDYIMGSSGELPGGRSTTFRVTGSR